MKNTHMFHGRNPLLVIHVPQTPYRGRAKRPEARDFLPPCSQKRWVVTDRRGVFHSNAHASRRIEVRDIFIAEFSSMRFRDTRGK